MKGIKEKIISTTIKNVYVFDKHFRNQLKEKLEIIEVFFANQLINYIAYEAHEISVKNNEYYLQHLFSEKIFKSTLSVEKACEKALKRALLGCKELNNIEKTEIWKYKGSFSLGGIRYLYNSLQHNHKIKFIEYLDIGSISASDLSIALLAFNNIRNKFSHAEQIINTKSFILPSWIEKKGLTPHEKIALFLISYTSSEFYKSNLKSLLSNLKNKNIENFYDWKKVAKEKQQQITNK